MDPIALSQMAAGLGLLGGAVVVKQLMNEAAMMGPVRCPTCNGSGQINCLCSRWSDGDAGCRTCGGSLRMTCTTCGGTGTARPISLRIPASRRRN